jgi:hypothetical protein
MNALWAAVDRLGEIWISNPRTAVFRAGLEPPAVDLNNPFATSSSSVQPLLITYTVLQSQPLLLGKRLVFTPEFQQQLASGHMQEWADVAKRYAFVLVEIVEFLRSRLPGYPNLPVPDLLPQSPRVENNGLWEARFPWEREMRQARLHLQSKPKLLALSLEPDDGGEAMFEALTDIARALRASRAWTRFVEACHQLSSKDEQDAKVVRRAYRESMKGIDTVAGQLVVRRQAMQHGELSRLKRDVTGALAEYYSAFDEVDGLIDATAAVISHRVAHGAIDDLSPLTASWGPCSELREVRFKAFDDDVFSRHPFTLVRVTTEISALSGIVLIHGTTANIDFKDGTNRLTVQGRLLTGSS